MFDIENIMNPELKELIRIIVVGLTVGAVISVPVIIWRYFKEGRILPQKKSPTPKWTWPLGICLFGFSSIMSFCTDNPYFGTFFAIFCVPYIIGLAKSIKSNKPSDLRDDPHGEN